MNSLSRVNRLTTPSNRQKKNKNTDDKHMFGYTFVLNEQKQLRISSEMTMMKHF